MPKSFNLSVSFSHEATGRYDTRRSLTLQPSPESGGRRTATPLWTRLGVDVNEGGVALRLPPHSRREGSRKCGLVS
jgi:hypothetical protein